MNYWGAIADLLNRQAARTITGAGNPGRAVAVASGLTTSAPAAIHAASAKEFEGSMGGGSSSAANIEAGKKVALEKYLATDQASQNYPY